MRSVYVFRAEQTALIDQLIMNTRKDNKEQTLFPQIFASSERYRRGTNSCGISGELTIESNE